MQPLTCEIADYPDGIVLPVDKPYRWTSADVIRKVKYAAIRHFRKKNLKVGHAGTLDPLATGVLLVCIGPACKRAQQLQDHDKEYIARIRFGATTPSYDLEKEPDRMFPYAHVTEEAVRAVLPSFLGTQEQVAPLFSAKSVDGVRSYERARRLYRLQQQGTEIPDFDAAAMEILHRATITVSELELLDFQKNPSSVEEGMDRSSPDGASGRIHLADTSALGLPEATVRIVCSKGTYIRSFARDLGEALGTGAHLSGLIRSRTGDYRVEEAFSLQEVLEALAP